MGGLMRWVILGLLLRYLVLFTAGCGTACPQVKASRCNGAVVELCGSNKRWQRVMDCAQVKAIRPGAAPRWRCAETGQGCACVPAE